MPRELAFTSPPALAVATGATTPVGRLGAEIWSTTALRRLVWTGTQWADALTGVQALQLLQLLPRAVFASNFNIPDWRTNPNGQVNAGWSAVQAALSETQTLVREYGGIIGARHKNPAADYPGSWSFHGGVLLPDGRVFCVPHGSTTARIYDPVKDTLITPTGVYPAAFHGAVLLPDGRVFCVPSNSTTARIYDPVSDTLTAPTGVYPGSWAFAGGTLLPDGRVFCVPSNSTTARIYDPVSDTLITPTGVYPGSAAFLGAVLLPDGRVFCVPNSSTFAAITAPMPFLPLRLPSNIVLSPFFNKL